MNVKRLLPASALLHLSLAALLTGLAAPAAYGNEVTDWNQFAATTLRKPEWTLLRRERALAMTQIAVYEAANAVTPRYTSSPLAIKSAPGASLPAAITEAAYRVLIDQLPAETPALNAEREKHLAVLPEGIAKTAGIEAGAKAAASVLHWRADDGADFTSTYKPGTGPGAYQLTGDAPVDEPLIGRMRPFAMKTSSQFRPGPPPTLDSAVYRQSLDEVRSVGGSKSTVRTPDQTEQAIFFRSPGIWPWSEAGRNAIAVRNFDEVDSARTLALLETAIMDGHLSSWEAKFTYNFWRPVTAIRAGTGLAENKLNAEWTPLIPTPPHPEYSCAHCCLGAAASAVLKAIFGDGPFPFTLQNNGVTRHFRSFADYAEQEANSRIYGGVHYRFSAEIGAEEGRKVGELVLSQAAKPLPAAVK